MNQRPIQLLTPPRDSGSSSPEAGDVVPYRPHGGPRTKKWAARVKTGCDTCRARRVKCDERKPICTQCVVARRECIGTEYGNDVNNPIIFGDPDFIALPRPTKGLHPADWSLQEAAKYFVEVQAPMDIYQDLGDNSSQSSADAATEIRKGPLDPWSFTAMVLQHRLLCQANALKIAPSQSKIPALNHMWEMMYEHLSMCVQNINIWIRNESRPAWIIFQIANILGWELGLGMPTWRLHARGMAGVVAGYGGVENLKEMKGGGHLSLQFAYVVATACNATSPITDQIDGFTEWSRNEVEAAYAHTGRESIPCPTILFIELIEITRLRGIVHTGERSRTQVFRNALKISKTIHDFDPSNWVEKYDTSDVKSNVIARLFKAAVIAYAVLALPPRLAKLFTGQAQETPDSPRAHCRDKLFEAFTAAWDALSLLSLGWPVAVLGVAVAGSPTHIEQVRRWLEVLRWRRNSQGGPHELIPLLEEFWESGKTGWEDCFYKPISALL